MESYYFIESYWAMLTESHDLDSFHVHYASTSGTRAEVKYFSSHASHAGCLQLENS